MRTVFWGAALNSSLAEHEFQNGIRPIHCYMQSLSRHGNIAFYFTLCKIKCHSGQSRVHLAVSIEQVLFQTGEIASVKLISRFHLDLNGSPHWLSSHSTISHAQHYFLATNWAQAQRGLVSCPAWNEARFCIVINMTLSYFTSASFLYSATLIPLLHSRFLSMTSYVYAQSSQSQVT